MGELIHTFVATAERVQHGKTCLDGMRLLAERLHPYGVKITWLVSPESARIAQKELTAWHEKDGDEVALFTPEIEGTFEEKRAVLERARGEIERTLPWAKVAVLGGMNHKDVDIVRLCETLGFEGLWGFCWEQIVVDEITDRGCPWGFYYMDSADRLKPGSKRGVVSMPWLSHDLLKTHHCGNAPIFTNDPNDVARASICSWEDITYWKAFIDNYHRNTRYNEQVFLLQHQEAHEMECNERNHCYTPEDIAESMIMLEKYTEYIQPKATFMSLSEAIRAYREHNEQTASSYMLWEDTETRPLNPDYSWNTCIGPWPKTFLHYDCGAQMVFVEGQVQPKCIRNYARTWDAKAYYAEACIPVPKLLHNTRYHWAREIEILVDAPKAMPYGLTLWGDYSLYQIAEAPGLLEGKILPRELLYLRYDLQAGENRLRIRLQGK